MIEYYNEDCMVGMKRYGDKHFSLAIDTLPCAYYNIYEVILCV